MERRVHLHLGWQSTSSKLLSLNSDYWELNNLVDGKRSWHANTSNRCISPLAKSTAQCTKEGISLPWAWMDLFLWVLPEPVVSRIYSLLIISVIVSLTLGLERNDTILPSIKLSILSWTLLSDPQTRISSKKFKLEPIKTDSVCADNGQTGMDMAANPGLTDRMTPWLNSTMHLLPGSPPGVKVILEECRSRAWRYFNVAIALLASLLSFRISLSRHVSVFPSLLIWCPPNFQGESTLFGYTYVLILFWFPVPLNLMI